MRGIPFALVLALVICGAPNLVGRAYAAVERTAWHLSSGKEPSKAAFAAVVAACRDQAKNSTQWAPIDGCLVDYGLRRAAR